MGFLKYGCCFPVANLYIYSALIPFLAAIVCIISYKVYTYHWKILTMEERLLERRVKRMAVRLGKNSVSENVRALSRDPGLASNSTNKSQMTKIPIDLDDRPGGGTTIAAAAAAAQLGLAAAPGCTSTVVTSEEPLSARTPARDPPTNEEGTAMSGYRTPVSSSAEPVVSGAVTPKGQQQPKPTGGSDKTLTTEMPDIDDKSSGRTPLTSAATSHSRTDTTTTATTSSLAVEGIAEPKQSTGAPGAIGGAENTDTLKFIDDPVFGLKTDSVSPDTKKSGGYSIDPFQSCSAPQEPLHGRPSISKPVESSSPPEATPSSSKLTKSAQLRIEAIPAFTPPLAVDSPAPTTARRISPLAEQLAPSPRPQLQLQPKQKQQSRPVQPSASRPTTHRRFPAPPPTPVVASAEPVSERGGYGHYSKQQQQPSLFSSPPPSSTRRCRDAADLSQRLEQRQSSTGTEQRARFDRNYAKPKGYFLQRASAWLAANRDSDSEEEEKGTKIKH